MISKEAAQTAYSIGAQKALIDAGLIKQARLPWEEEPGSAWWPGIFGPIAAPFAAPSGERLGAFGGSLLGAGLGGAIGSYGLGGLGELAALGVKKPGAKAALKIVPNMLGGLIGSSLGSAGGYRLAVGD